MAKKKKAEKPQREVTRRQLSHWQQQQKRQRIAFFTGVFTISAVILIIAVGWFISEFLPLRQTAIRVNGAEFDMRYYIDMLRVELQSVQQPSQYAQLMADSAVRDIQQNELLRQGALKLGVTVSDQAIAEELKKSDLPDDAVHRDLARGKLLLDKLRDEYFEQQVPAAAEQVHLLAMLLESQSQAAEVRNRLEAGESFAGLYQELALGYGSSDGDPGWHPRSILSDLLGSSVPVDYAFSAAAGTLSPPLHDAGITKGVGYWLIKVLSRDEDNEEAHILAMLLGSQEEAQGIRDRLEAGESFADLAVAHSLLPGVRDDSGDLGLVLPGEWTPAFDQFAFSETIALETLSQPIQDREASTQGGYWLVRVLEKDANRQIAADDRDLLKSKALGEWATALREDPANQIDDSYLTDERKAWATARALKGLGQ